MKDLDTCLTIADIAICLVDMALVIYLIMVGRRAARSPSIPSRIVHRRASRTRARR